MTTPARCPGCGRPIHAVPPAAPGTWCGRCCTRIEEVARTTLPGPLARFLDRVAGRLLVWEWKLRLAGEAVAERLLTLPAWFTKRVD